MSRKTRYRAFVKKHWHNVVFLAVMAVLVFHAGARTWMLRRLFDVGLFKAEMPVPGKVPHDPAPVASLSFTNAEGRVVHTANLKGKVVFINFWAPWCPPCRAEMPSINALYQNLKRDSSFVFLLVDVDGNLEKSAAYLRREGISLPVYTPAGQVPETLFSGTLPTTVVLSPDGAIAYRHEGIANYSTTGFQKRMQALLP